VLRLLSCLQAITRKTRVLDVSYNASNNELVSTQQQQMGAGLGSSGRVQRAHSSRWLQGMEAVRHSSRWPWQYWSTTAAADQQQQGRACK
jgi:hypothetical protein